MKTKRKKIDLLHFPSSYYHSFRSRSNENLKIEKTQNFTYKYHQNYISYNFFHIISAFGILQKFSTHSDFNILRDVFTKKFSAVSNTVKFSSKTNVRGAIRSITHALRSLSVSCRMLGLQQARSRFRIDFFVANLRGPLSPLCARVFAKHTSGVLRRNSATKFCGQFARANV